MEGQGLLFVLGADISHVPALHQFHLVCGRASIWTQLWPLSNLGLLQVRAGGAEFPSLSLGYPAVKQSCLQLSFKWTFALFNLGTTQKSIWEQWLGGQEPRPGSGPFLTVQY